MREEEGGRPVYHYVSGTCTFAATTLSRWEDKRGITALGAIWVWASHATRVYPCGPVTSCNVLSHVCYHLSPSDKSDIVFPYLILISLTRLLSCCDAVCISC